jgi:hypothetical protein
VSQTLTAAAFNVANQTSANFPLGVLGGTFDGTNYTLYQYADLFSASIPANLGSTLMSSPVTLDAKFLGMHVLAESAAVVAVNTARSHDMAPRWSQMNPASGVFVDAGMGAWLSAMKSVNADTIVTIFGTPTWASSRPSETGDPYGTLGGIAEPASLASLGAFITWLMTTYGSQIDYVEIWNEPKYSAVIGGSFFSGTPSMLAQMAKTINQSAKAVKPSIKIIGVGATACVVQSWAPGDLSGLDFTNKFLIASDGATGTGASWIDILSIHTYEHSGVNAIEKMQYLQSNIAGIKATSSISAMPVWSTEYGYIDPDLTKYSPATGKISALKRYAMYNVVAGMARAVYYSFSSPIGWQGDPIVTAAWNDFAALLNGATVTRINRIGAAGSLACVINGQNLLI